MDTEILAELRKFLVGAIHDETQKITQNTDYRQGRVQGLYDAAALIGRHLDSLEPKRHDAEQAACVVTNVSDLTPAMRTEILNGNLRDCPAGTRDALLRRGLATGRAGRYQLTAAGRRARVILESRNGS